MDAKWYPRFIKDTIACLLFIGRNLDSNDNDKSGEDKILLTTEHYNLLRKAHSISSLNGSVSSALFTDSV